MNVKKIVIILFLMLFSVFVISPLAWMFVTSLKTGPEAISKEPSWIPQQPNLDAYPWVIEKFGDSFTVTILASVGSSWLTLVLTVFGGYGLARFGFPGRKAISIAYLAGLMFPPVLIGVPVYVMFARIRLTDTILGLILIYTAGSLPFVVWLLRGYFLTIPYSLEEAAIVDGCSRMGAFFRVVLPLSYPGLIVASLFSFLSAWNDTLFSLIITSTNQTVSVRMLFWVLDWYRAQYWPGLMAGAVLAILPPVIVFLVAQKQFITGLTAGAVKG